MVRLVPLLVLASALLACGHAPTLIAPSRYGGGHPGASGVTAEPPATSPPPSPSQMDGAEPPHPSDALDDED